MGPQYVLQLLFFEKSQNCKSLSKHPWQRKNKRKFRFFRILKISLFQKAFFCKETQTANT
jgi:hypothetical protein